MDTRWTDSIVRGREAPARMKVSSFVILYFGTNIFIRCWKVSVLWKCPLMEVAL